MSLKKLRTEEWIKLCDRATLMRENVPSCPLRQEEWGCELADLESEIYDLVEDGIDRQYAARIGEWL